MKRISGTMHAGEVCSRKRTASASEGGDGSGKTTQAHRLAAALDGVISAADAAITAASFHALPGNRVPMKQHAREASEGGRRERSAETPPASACWARSGDLDRLRGGPHRGALFPADDRRHAAEQPARSPSRLEQVAGPVQVHPLEELVLLAALESLDQEVRALQHPVKPDVVATVFAGGERPPSSE